MEFSKYEGTGNDFVVIDNRAAAFDPRPEVVAALCDRRFGIGADGLMLLENDPRHLFRMRYFNSDGPEATMCGNGGRCIVLFAEHLGIGGSSKEFVASDGPHAAAVNRTEGETADVSLGMSDVSGITPYGNGWLVDTGSPHYVEFVDSAAGADVCGRGRDIRYRMEAAVPGGVNVDFVEVLDASHLSMRTYERGVEDETLSCGTGAVAAAIACVRERFPRSSRFVITVPGGTLRVSLNRRPGSERFTDIRLSGPARRIYRGIIKPDNFTGRN